MGILYFKFYILTEYFTFPVSLSSAEMWDDPIIESKEFFSTIFTNLFSKI